jgi:hypothetical protein
LGESRFRVSWAWWLPRSSSFRWEGMLLSSVPFRSNCVNEPSHSPTFLSMLSHGVDSVVFWADSGFISGFIMSMFEIFEQIQTVVLV